MHYSYTPRIVQTIAWLPTRLLLMFFCRFKVTGTSHLKKLSSAIFAVNHASELDSILITAALSPFGKFSPLFYVLAPYENFRHDRFGWRQYIYSRTFFNAWGAYAVARGHRSYERSLKDHVAIVSKGHSLCIFPEGRMSKDGQHTKAHGGVAYLCAATQVPIVPVSISGSFGLSPHHFIRRRKKLRVSFGKAIYPNDLFGARTDLSAEDYKIAAEKVLEKISTGSL